MIFILSRTRLTHAIALVNKLMNKGHKVTKNGTLRVEQIEHNPYLELRKVAFSTTRIQLGNQFPNVSNKLYGIITDIANGPEVSTVVTLLNGHASIYLSSGDGFIASRQHESVQSVVKEFINIGHLISIEGNKIDYPEPPKNGTVNFYFLSDKGKTKITECLLKLEKGRSNYTKLFLKLNDVIEEIKLKSIDNRYSYQYRV